jgi:hypothetical protein
LIGSPCHLIELHDKEKKRFFSPKKEKRSRFEIHDAHITPQGE